VLILEDAHWLDGLSWQVAIQIVRTLALSNTPLLFVLVNRPLDENSMGQKVRAELRAMSITQSLALAALEPNEIVALIANRLNVTVKTLPVPLIELVQSRANGNPFFVEELIFNLRDNGILTQNESRVILSQDLSQTVQTLPDTLHGLILSRIDRLPPQRQFVVKVAAVIGRAFAFTSLHHVVSQYVTMMDESLKEHLTSLTKADFTFLETLEPELTYLFKHIITQEAAYQTLLFEQRRELHRLVAEWCENRGQVSGDREQKDSLTSDLRALYPLLAYHYRYAEDVEKERYYLELAGEAAEKVYANDAAIGFYTRLLALIDPQDQADLLLKRGKIFELIGRWNEAEQDYRTALALAEQIANPRLIAHSQLNRGDLLRQRGDYAQSVEWCQFAQVGFEALNDLSGQTSALASQGEIAHLRGDYALAREYLALGLKIACEANDHPSTIARLRSGLATVDRRQGNLARAQQEYEEALRLAQQVNDRNAVARYLSSLSSIARSHADATTELRLSEQALTVLREIGDRSNIALVLRNLGMYANDRQDYISSQRYFEESLTISREIGNKEGISATLEYWAYSMIHQKNYAQAEVFLQESLAVAQAIGNKRRSASVLGHLGTVSQRQGDYSAAQTYLQSSLARLREVGYKKGIADTLNSLGVLAVAQGDYASARTWLEESLTHYRQISNKIDTATVLNNLALTMIRQSAYTTARTLYQESLPIMREHRPNFLPYILIGLTAITIHLGMNVDVTRFSAAIETWRASASTPLAPFVIPFHEHNLTQARTALTQDEFDAAWAQGTQMTIIQAIDEALKLTERV
jgi:predicted ATPase